MHIETSDWSGDGSFTEALIESLKEHGSMVYLRVEDAPATHADTGYQFISNEVFVAFASTERVETRSEERRFAGWVSGLEGAGF